MEKILLFIRNAIKALIGIPITIGCWELLNLTISIMIGQYVRFDGGELSVVIEDYIMNGIMGYFLAWILIICGELVKDRTKDDMQKTKSIITSTWIIIALSTILGGFILSDFYMVLEINIAFGLLFGIALILVYIYDKKVINKINKKIKENERKD